eukprot:CAMPEP_0172044982 /NCGR_PEP_ID=MMETSP1041-20130122/27099_1 /TAXON_ID=464988 /ORGANISM="Hemiselmis andersenii, Strain CCMP439" /LENGTH=87 /DNA_ID=CAMNT_0012703537 /DNA_START=229 /DNA_END=489 /DNA_ORIENTATION=-
MRAGWREGFVLGVERALGDKLVGAITGHDAPYEGLLPCKLMQSLLDQGCVDGHDGGHPELARHVVRREVEGLPRHFVHEAHVHKAVV